MKPDLTELSHQLKALIVAATDDDLMDRGAYFSESCNDLTRCYHGDTGRYCDPEDGKLVEFLWNNRRVIVRALETVGLIDALRDDEGNAVTISCDNPEGPPNNAIEVTADWTDWEPRRFEGDNVLDALRAAAFSRPDGEKA